MPDVSVYRTNSIYTSPPDQVLLMLFERAIQDMDTAATAMERGARIAWIEAINHARSIFVELQSALDHQLAPALTRSLHQVYAWALLQLTVASRERDLELLRAVRSVTVQLYESWRVVVAMAAGEAPAEPMVESASGAA